MAVIFQFYFGCNISILFQNHSQRVFKAVPVMAHIAILHTDKILNNKSVYTVPQTFLPCDHRNFDR